MINRQFKKELNKILEEKKKTMPIIESSVETKKKEKKFIKNLNAFLENSILEATKKFELDYNSKEMIYTISEILSLDSTTICIEIKLVVDGSFVLETYYTEFPVENLYNILYNCNGDYTIKVCEDSNEMLLERDIINPFLQDLNPVRF